MYISYIQLIGVVFISKISKTHFSYYYKVDLNISEMSKNNTNQHNWRYFI